MPSSARSASASSAGLSYVVVDVFADTAFSGNQLAVVHDTEGLTDAQLHALTREFGWLADPLEGVNLYALAGPAVRSRVFVPGLAVPEDPATGSAAAGLGMALVASGRLPAGGSYEITQGVEMGRPSRLFGRVDVEGGVATRCHVAGRVFPVARGTIAVPAP